MAGLGENLVSYFVFIYNYLKNNVQFIMLICNLFSIELEGEKET